MAGVIKHYDIYVDCNAIRGKHVISEENNAIITRLKESRLPKITLWLPEIVRDEWAEHYATSVVEQLTKIKSIEGVFESYGIDQFKFEAPTETQIYESAHKYLSALGLVNLTTPYSKIKLRELAERAVKKLPPFENSEKLGDKGFKDALIVQTIVTHIRALDETHAKFIVTNDGKFQDYAKELLADAKVKIFSDFTSLENAIELDRKGLNSSLAEQAAEMFFNGDKKVGLYYDAGIWQKIRNFYDDHIGNLERASQYIDNLPNENYYAPPPLSDLDNLVKDKPTYKIGSTSFIGSKEHILQWETLVSIEQPYTGTKTRYTPSTGEREEIPYTVIHKFTMAIKWHTKLAKNGKLTSPQYKSERPVSDAKLPDKHGGFSSLATLLNPALNIQKSVQQQLKSTGGLSEFAKMQASSTLSSALGASVKSAQSAILPSLKTTSNLSSLLNSLAGPNRSRKSFWEN